MVQLLAYDNDNSRWVNLDLQEELTISLNKSIEEIQDITQRKTSFTKTFSIPSTDNNERFFRSAFNVNATDFNNKLQTQCVIQHNGNDVFGGKMRLNKITVDLSGTQYEVYIVQEVAPFASNLKNFNICELDFSDAQHEVNYDSIVSTWGFSGGSYNNYTGITGNVLYPMAHTGYDEDIPYGKFELGSGGILSPSNPLLIEQFKPWLNLKYMVDLVFEKAGFTYTSEFFDTEYFKTIFVLAGTSDTSGAAVLGGRPENQNVFNVRYEGPSYFYPAPSNITQFDTIVFNTVDYDYLDSFTESGYPATGPGTGLNYFTAPITGSYQFLIKQRMWLAGTVYAPTYIDVAIRNIDNGSIKSIQSGIGITPGGATIKTFYLNCNLTKGERVAVQFRRQTSGGDPYNTIGFSFESSKWELYSSPNVVSSLGDIKWDDNIPCDVSGLDFIQNIIRMFNLTVISDGENNFLIEPWVNYLSTNSGTTYDWSSKLDLNSSYEIKPLDFDLQRQIHLTYTQSDDVLNTYYQDNFNTIFGEKYFTKQSELLTGNQELEFIFEPLPTKTFTPGTTMVMPYLHKFGEPNTDPREIPMSTKMRLGFYCGMNHFYTSDTAYTPTDYYILSGTTSVAHDEFPMVNHLSLLQEPPDFGVIYPFSDLNFKSTYDFFMSETDYLGYTPNDVFNNFYKNYLELLYSDEARFFKGKFILTPEDIAKINFNDSIYFLNSRWRLYSMNDADITQKSVVECEFLKEPYRVDKVDPPGPNYFIQNRERTPPGPTPTNTLYWYVENNLGSLAVNIVAIDLEVWQDTTQYLNQLTTGSGTVQIPSGDNFYSFRIRYQPNAGSLNNLRITLGPSSGDGSYAQLDIPQPITNGNYSIQADVYFPASGNLYATIDTY